HGMCRRRGVGYCGWGRVERQERNVPLTAAEALNQGGRIGISDGFKWNAETLCEGLAEDYGDAAQLASLRIFGDQDLIGEDEPYAQLSGRGQVGSSRGRHARHRCAAGKEADCEARDLPSTSHERRHTYPPNREAEKPRLASAASRA